jgi:hypothetical protein
MKHKHLADGNIRAEIGEGDETMKPSSSSSLKGGQMSSRQPITAISILDTALGGTTFAELHSEISLLSKSELQALLCAVCSIREEVVATCPERGNDMDWLLRTKCTFYRAESGVCPVGFFYKMKE